MNKQVSLAVEAVARQVGGISKASSESQRSEITVGGKRVVIDAIALEAYGTVKNRIRLRFDKVVIGLMEHLQNHCGESVDDGKVVVLTVTAPIRLPWKTALAIEEKIQTVTDRGLTKAMIHGNRVQIRVLRHGLSGLPKVIGFVHNTDSDPQALVKLVVDLIDLTRHGSRKSATKPATERALVLVDTEGVTDTAAYRYICSQLHLTTVFQKIFVVFEKQRVEVLVLAEAE